MLPPLILGGFLVLAAGYAVIDLTHPFSVKYEASVSDAVTAVVQKIEQPKKYPPLDKALYDQKIAELAHNPVIVVGTSSTSTVTVATKWPAKTAYPKDGALLPFNRIVAYYGNFYSKNMGVLGEYPTDTMLSMLQGEAAKWKAADPSTPVIPAIQYIAVTAQGAPGADSKWRLRMPADQIQKAIDLAKRVNGITILDVQVGTSDLQHEIPLLDTYLKMPDVELAIDPEFSMKDGLHPGGAYIGTMDASDINYASSYLADLVKKYDLPPKILVVHRFTQHMITNYQNIQTPPEVQIIMNMDGWGPPANKITTYKLFVASEPVQFTGFKLFYKNDTKNAGRMLTPAELLNLRPIPSYIQYQ